MRIRLYKGEARIIAISEIRRVPGRRLFDPERPPRAIRATKAPLVSREMTKETRSMRNEMSYHAGRTGYPVRRLGAGRAVSFLALVLIGVVLIGAEPYPVRAADGDIDTGFGNNGVVLTDFIPGADNQGEAVVIQPDGKIVAGGNALTDDSVSGVLARFNLNGSLDTSFGSQGKVIVDNFAGIDVLALQSDGKLVAGGGAGSGVALLRFNPDGGLDANFGSGGKVTTGGMSILALAIQPDSKIVAGGVRNKRASDAYTFGVMRFNPDGSLDEGFGSGGVVTADFGSDFAVAISLVLQSDGKIVAAGKADVRSAPGSATSLVNAFAIARFNLNGSLDAGFGVGGLVTTQFTQAEVHAVVTLEEGKILALGRDTQAGGDYLATTRYNGDGTLDLSFGSRGKLASPFFVENGGRLKTVEMAPDGSLVAAGRAIDPAKGGPGGLALARYHNDGTADLSFGTGGKVITRISGRFDGDTVSALAFQADGRIVAVGDSATYDHMAVARYDAAAPDFALAFSDPTQSVPRGTNVRVTLNISRSAGFIGEVTITASDTSDLRIKVKPGSVSTRDASVSFKIKVKGSAPTGPQQISFTGKSDFGATRTTRLVVVVE